MSDDEKQRGSRRTTPALIKALDQVKLSRRLVLGGLFAAQASIAAAQPVAATGARRRAIVGDQRQFGRPFALRQRTISVVRPDDLLILEFDFVNLTATGSGANRRLVRVNGGSPARLVVGMAPQAIAEGAYRRASVGAPMLNEKEQLEPGAEPPLPPPDQAVPARLAGPTRLAFEMPSGVNQIPYSLASLLDACRSWPLALDAAAIPAPGDAGLTIPGAFNLEAASAALATSLSRSRSPAFDRRLDVASERIAQTLATSARRGAVSDIDVDTLISRELTASGIDTSRLSDQETLAVRGLVEAAALSRLPQIPPAFVGPPAPPRPPRDDVTAIELPYRLIQSPLAGAGFDHAIAAPPTSGRAELWHTRLGKRRSQPKPNQHVVDDRAVQPLRALWSPDYPESVTGDNAAAWALDHVDRRMLVKLTARVGANDPGGKDVIPRPTQARRLMLSALGGWLDAEGQWTVRPTDADIEAWKHQTSMARDSYVRVVYAGFLFPFGHAASLVKETQRKFMVVNGERIALLIQRSFIIVRERSKTYPVPNQNDGGRSFPFTQVEILTAVTPDLSQPGFPSSEINHLPNGFYNNDPALYRQAFWPMLENGSADIQFQVLARDAGGRQIGFMTPMMFVSENRNTAGQVGQIASFYNAAKLARRKRSLNGAVLQFGPNTDTGDTSMPTDSITLQAGVLNPHTVYAPRFHPKIATAEVRLPAVEQMLDKAGPQEVVFSKQYLAGGFDAPDAGVRQNPGELFLDLKTPPTGGGSSEKMGGLMSPNLKPTALSRRFGAVGGDASGGQPPASDFLAGKFNPASFIPADVKLLGVFPLRDILKLIDFSGALGASPSSGDLATLAKVPKLVNLDFPNRVETTFTIHQDDLKGVGEIFKPKPSALLDITTTAIAFRDGTAPQTRIDGRLTDFRINLFGCLMINFERLNFSVEPGRKPDVNVDLTPTDGVMFGGPLGFINDLKDYLPANGFSDPPGLSVTPGGITASYSLGLPPVTIGVMTLQNVSVGAAFSLPFDGRPPSARFNFAERQSPFTLTISAIGGGGFVALCVDTGGVQEIEAALEFGAQIAIDLGVASGSVYVKGGFYFHWKDQGATSLVELEAYVELGGHLSVLGLITVSLVFHLGLTYEKDGDLSRLYGQATLTVEVEVLFFSFSVGVTVERQFAGGRDPLFIDLVKPNHWNDYCSAFAA